MFHAIFCPQLSSLITYVLDPAQKIDCTTMSSDGAPLTFADVAEDVVLIAVMGVTGSGKSTFIKRVTGSEEVVIGKDLTSCIELVPRVMHSG